MANDLTALQTDIGLYIPRSDIASATVITNINASIREYEGYRFWFNEQALGPVTLSATNTYSLSLWAPGSSASTAADVVELDSVRVNLANRAYTLTEKSYIELNDFDEQSGSTPGYPEFYAIYNKQLRVYPVPQSTVAMTATLSAHVKFPDLASGTDANCWTSDARWIIIYSTCKRLFGGYLQDPDQAAIFAQLESARVAVLQRRTSGLAGNRIRSVL